MQDLRILFMKYPIIIHLSLFIIQRILKIVSIGKIQLEHYNLKVVISGSV